MNRRLPLRLWVPLILAALLAGSLCVGHRAAAQALHPDSTAVENAPEPAVVTLRDEAVFRLYRGVADQDAAQRAKQVSRALMLLATAKGARRVHWAPRGDEAVVFVDQTPVVALSEEDARLAQKASLESLATEVTSAIAAALERERKRSSLANTVFSASLVVFMGLLTLVLARKLQDWALRAHGFLERNPERVPALHVGSLEVVGPASVRNGLVILLGLGRWLSVVGLVYTWLVASLSLFERTRPFVEKLTGYVLSPLYSLIERVALSLPMFVVVLVAAFVVAVLVRAVELFFVSVTRGESHLPWVDRDMAPAMSVVARGALILAAILFVAPVITGDPNGALSRTALVVFACVAFAASPLITCVLSGLVVVFSRAVHLGDRIDYGGYTGQVREIGLVWIELEDEQRCRVRVPHLRALWHPTRVYPRGRP